jgi:(p)ppGpp synthase/HD superfamily hydrolase
LDPVFAKDLVTAARTIAALAHRGQVDKTGAPYIDHPRRVAANVGDASATQAVAWLHDVLEDSDLEAEDLIAAGIPSGIVEDVQTLTRVPHEPAEAYYERVYASPTARRVKLADIADNTDVDRLALIEDDATIVRLVRKYAKARLLLGESGV